jgi:aminoglycoside phosphotransferase (APT) family kinase protein
MDVDDAQRFEWLEHGLGVASELRGLDPVVDQALSWVSATSLTPPAFEGLLRFIHHDLSPEHLLVDPTTGRLTGILDWTDAILGDPVRDFVTLVTWRGWEFTEDVLRSYSHSVDRAFRERLDFMARLLSLMWLAYAHEQRSEVAKHIEWVRNAYAPV